jgi:hypothetical protein
VTRAAVILVIALAALAQSASAESVFSVNGLGETVLLVDARGMGMGGAGLALTSPWHMSLENPALLARVQRFSFGAALMPEVRKIALNESTGTGLTERHKTASFTYFPFFRLTHKLPGEISAAAAMGMQQRVSYQTEVRNDEGGVQVVDIRSGEGGIGFISLSAAREVTERLLLGAELRILLGTIEDERNLSIVGETALETRDVVKTAFGGEPVGRVGAHLTLGRGFAVGATYQFSRMMDVTTTTFSRDVEILRSVDDVTYPAMGGLGVVFEPDSRTTLTAEWFRTAWGQTGALAGYEGEMVDADRFSFGFERRKGEGDYLVPLRVGYLWRELSYRKSGASGAPTEFAFTFGFGLPFRGDNGSFDVSVQLGSRGDLEVDRARERFLRFTLSVVGTEFLENLMPGVE